MLKSERAAHQAFSQSGVILVSSILMAEYLVGDILAELTFFWGIELGCLQRRPTAAIWVWGACLTKHLYNRALNSIINMLCACVRYILSLQCNWSQCMRCIDRSRYLCKRQQIYTTSTNVGFCVAAAISPWTIHHVTRVVPCWWSLIWLSNTWEHKPNAHWGDLSRTI